MVDDTDDVAPEWSGVLVAYRVDELDAALAIVDAPVVERGRVDAGEIHVPTVEAGDAVREGGVSEVVDRPELAGDDGGRVGADTVDAFEALAGLLGAFVDVEFDAVLELRKREVADDLIAFQVLDRVRVVIG